MKKHVPLMLVILGFCLFACQTGEETAESPSGEIQGVQFQKIGWNETIAQAKEQNKLILIDFFSPT